MNVSTDLKTVIGISENNQVIELKLEIQVEWYENRANYYNLKENSALNVLAYQELAQMWIPYIIFFVSINSYLLFLKLIEIFRILTLMRLSKLRESEVSVTSLKKDHLLGLALKMLTKPKSTTYVFTVSLKGFGGLLLA